MGLNSDTAVGFLDLGIMRDAAVHVGDSISTVEAIQYCGGIAAVLRGVASVHVGDSISTCGG